MPAFIEHAGDGIETWDGASIQIQCGAFIDTWQYDTEIGEDASSVYEVVESIADWGNDAGARPWGGAYTFSTDYPEIPLTGQLGATLTCSGTATFTPDAELQQLLDWSTTTATSITSATGLLGSLDAKAKITPWLRWNKNKGAHCRDGAFLMGTGSVALRRPGIDLVCTQVQVIAWMAALEMATAPRRAYIYDQVEDSWRLVELGKTGRPRRRFQLYTWSWEGIG